MKKGKKIQLIFKDELKNKWNLNKALPEGWQFEDRGKFKPFEEEKIIGYDKKELFSGKILLDLLHEAGEAHWLEQKAKKATGEIAVDEVVEASERERFGWYFALRAIRKMRDEGLPLEKYFKDNQELREYYHKCLKEWYEYYKDEYPGLKDIFTKDYRLVEAKNEQK